MTPLHREVSGQGRPVVLWHGWGMNLRVFDALRDALSESHEVIAVDLPGHGRSRWHDGDEDALLEALLETVPPAAMLVGWSLGGQFALRAALRDPSRLRALVLLNTTPRFVRSADWEHGAEPDTLRQFAAQLRSDYHQLVADFLMLQVRGSAHSEASLRTLRAALLSHGEAHPAALDAGLQWLETQDLRALLPRIAAHTLVVSGQHDRVTPPGAARALAHSLPHAQLLEIPRAGHTPFISHLPQLLPVLQRFLEAA